MIFVDSNVFMYAVGGPHPLQPAARRFFAESLVGRTELVTSAEVLQELAHSYLPVGRLGDFDKALEHVSRFFIAVWPLEQEDVELARVLSEQYPSLQARDLCYLASCQRRGVRQLMTFDESLKAVADGPGW